ncbi:MULTISPECIES: YgaP family membrane protein [Olleya]|uniref:Inner membrane protein YgaP-like transmembrane domain-containing protein n=1 Tax=Olleya namhaensis TaxID=1144750 RepID=A0A1I3PVV9_9FLAO|nr:MULTISPECIES: DUF2892 domain-containing protein [Olleya]PKG51539.1 DUF2892 domain-containing protein [Olleya sp. 1-3]SFJ25472.1 Protein of unknown function [Olleya namhaensis]
MKKNMGALDKSLRVLAAIFIALLYYLDILSGMVAYVLMAVAIVFLITSFVNFCPLYAILGVNTCKRK